MGEYRQHKGRMVELYMQENADRVVYIEEVAQHVGWSNGSTSTRLSRMLVQYPDHMERVGGQRGVYRWNSTSTAAAPAQQPVQQRVFRDGKQVHGSQRATTVAADVPDEMIVVVVSRQGANGAALVRDEATQRLYTIKPFVFRA